MNLFENKGPNLVLKLLFGEHVLTEVSSGVRTLQLHPYILPLGTNCSA